jgi:hypothetical protein
MTAFFPKAAPADCRILLGTDSRTLGQAFTFTVQPPDRQYPVLWFWVYRYTGPGTYTLSEPPPRTLDGVLAQVRTGFESGYENPRGSIKITAEAGDSASGTLNITRMDSVDMRVKNSISVTGAWTCGVSFRGHPTPPPMVTIPAPSPQPSI